MPLYVKSRFTRTVSGYVIALLLAVLELFGCLYSGLIAGKVRDMEDAYSLPVGFVLSNLTGTDAGDIRLSGVLLRSFTRYRDGYDDYFDRGVYPDLRPYFSTLTITASLTVVTAQAPTEDGYSAVDYTGDLIGATRVDTDIVWLDGERDFESDEDEFLVVPEALYDALPGGVLRLTVKKDDRPGLAVTELPIAGYCPGGETVYCPFELSMRLIDTCCGFPAADSLSGTLADSRQVEELRALLPTFFGQVSASGLSTEGPNGITYRQAAIIHDEELQSTLNSLARSLGLLRRLLPLVLAAEAVLAAGSAWFYIHIRRRELAVARSLGTAVSGVLAAVGLEFIILCALSLTAACALVAAIPICRFSPAGLALVPLTSTAAALCSAWLSSVRTSTIILKED